MDIQKVIRFSASDHFSDITAFSIVPFTLNASLVKSLVEK